MDVTQTTNVMIFDKPQSESHKDKTYKDRENQMTAV